MRSKHKFVLSLLVAVSLFRPIFRPSVAITGKEYYEAYSYEGWRDDHGHSRSNRLVNIFKIVFFSA